MLLLVVLPVVMMGVLFYLAFSDLIEQKAANYFRLALRDADRMLAYAMNEINSVTDLAVTQDAVQELLKAPPQWISTEQARELNSYIMTHPKVTSFSLYNNERLVYRTNFSSVDVPYEELIRSDAYRRAEARNGRPLWLAPGENEWSRSRTGEIVILRKIKEFHTLRDIGTLLVTVKADVLEQVFWEASVDGDILLLNGGGQIIYSKSGRRVGERLEPSLLAALQQPEEKDYRIRPFAGERSFIAYLPTTQNEWVMMAVTPVNRLFQEVKLVRNLAVAIVMFLLFTAYLFEKLFISRLVSKILKTVKGLRQVEEGRFRELAETSASGDEADLLVHGFNRMTRQIRDLIAQVEQEQRQKKEAEMQALIAQINPHFIYNSLESINSLAVLHGNRDISRMVVSLGKLLRISISENKELIPLEMELEHVRHYMRIQKYRFEDKFEYEFDLPAHLKSVMTQKLIIQPIVENALYHAIEPMSGKGLVRVDVVDQGRDVLIRIRDNGAGFDVETLEKLDRLPRRKKTDSGVGLINVHDRLRMRFGPRYGVLVCSAPGYGTTVQIRIPKLEEAAEERGADDRRANDRRVEDRRADGGRDDDRFTGDRRDDGRSTEDRRADERAAHGGGAYERSEGP
jgi:two-component system sensor histidine kinase YesM